MEILHGNYNCAYLQKLFHFCLTTFKYASWKCGNVYIMHGYMCTVSCSLQPASYERYGGFRSSIWNWVLWYHSTESHDV